MSELTKKYIVWSGWTYAVVGTNEEAWRLFHEFAKARGTADIATTTAEGLDDPKKARAEFIRARRELIRTRRKMQWAEWRYGLQSWLRRIGLAVAGVGVLQAGPVLMCHVPPGNPGNAHTIAISENAKWAHLRHGDTEGPCRTNPPVVDPEPPPVPPNPPVPPVPPPGDPEPPGPGDPPPDGPPNNPEPPAPDPDPDPDPDPPIPYTPPRTPYSRPPQPTGCEVFVDANTLSRLALFNLDTQFPARVIVHAVSEEWGTGGVDFELEVGARERVNFQAVALPEYEGTFVVWSWGRGVFMVLDGEHGQDCWRE